MRAYVEQPDANPTRKVGAGAIGGAIAAIVAWVLNVVAEVDIPPEVAIAASTVFSFILSYFVRDREI
jgi:putative flippase GtrA